MVKLDKIKLEKLKITIVIERLRQAPSKLKVSLDSASHRFMDRDELIKEVESGSDIGQRIVKVQLEYLKAFKKGIFVKQE